MAEGRKSAVTANVKINKWFGNPAVLLVLDAAHVSYNFKYNYGPFSYELQRSYQKIFICSITIETSCSALTHSSSRLKRYRHKKKLPLRCDDSSSRLGDTCGLVQKPFPLCYTSSFLSLFALNVEPKQQA